MSAKPLVVPEIPEGLSTRISKIVIALLGAYASVTLFLNGDHSAETITAIGGAVATLIGLTLSRGYQAAKAVEAVGAGGPVSPPDVSDEHEPADPLDHMLSDEREIPYPPTRDDGDFTQDEFNENYPRDGHL